MGEVGKRGMQAEGEAGVKIWRMNKSWPGKEGKSVLGGQALPEEGTVWPVIRNFSKSMEVSSIVSYAI